MNTNTNITATNKGNDMNTHTHHIALAVGNVIVRTFNRTFHVDDVRVGNVIVYTNARTGNAQMFRITSTSGNVIVARLTYNA